MRAAEKWVQPEHHQIVGSVLAAARRKANMTQVELAALLGKPQSVVSGYEAGKRRVDVVEFLLIVRTLGADPVEIFTEIAASSTTGG
jgi:transcriptional regulator with XRE-family HTH domain